MRHPRTITTAVAALLVALLGTACSTTPKAPKDGVARTTPESYYRVAPWTKTRPVNFAGLAAAMQEAAAATAQASAQYSASMNAIRAQQEAHHARQAAYMENERQINRCLGVGGGRAAGQQCFSMGYDAYQARQHELQAPPQIQVAPMKTPVARPGLDQGWYDGWQIGEATYQNFQSYDEWMRAEIQKGIRASEGVR